MRQYHIILSIVYRNTLQHRQLEYITGELLKSKNFLMNFRKLEYSIQNTKVKYKIIFKRNCNDKYISYFIIAFLKDP